MIPDGAVKVDVDIVADLSVVSVAQSTRYIKTSVDFLILSVITLESNQCHQWHKLNHYHLILRLM